MRARASTDFSHTGTMGGIVMNEHSLPRILIVDDDAAVCQLIRRHLQKAGYECTAAYSGEEALKEIEAGSFDLIVTDIMMPGMSGLDLLHIVRSLFPDIAVLMVTAVDDLATGMNAVELGAYGYILKPFVTNELLVNVAAALERRRDVVERNGGQKGASMAVRQQSEVGRNIIIPAKEVVAAVKSGMSDATLLETFRLTPESLHTLFDKLVDAGKLTSDDILERSMLSPNTVAIDLAELKFPEPGSEKPVIKARDAARNIQLGLSDAALMKKYNISAKGLESLLRKLVAAGLVSQTEVEARRRRVDQLLLVDD